MIDFHVRAQDCNKCLARVILNTTLLTGHSWQLGELGPGKPVVCHWATPQGLSVCGAVVAR